MGGETTHLLQVLITAGQLQPPAFHIEKVKLHGWVWFDLGPLGTILGVPQAFAYFE
jgi:hypothetical protein